MSNSFVIPWTIAHQAPLCMGYPRQEYWSGLLCPPLGDLTDPEIETMSSTLQADLFTTAPHGKPNLPLLDYNLIG